MATQLPFPERAARMPGGPRRRAALMDGAESLFYLGVGPLCAILLGMGLVPLRSVTTASNFTFVFLALTIVVAELGGRWAALSTALASALSLDFFLTQPYLQLRMDDKQDIIAFVGLTACGLIAALLGSHRRERVAALRAARKELDALLSGLAGLELAGPVESRLAGLIAASRMAFPVAALVVRDMHDRVLIASERLAQVPLPALTLRPDSLAAGERSLDEPGAERRPLPNEGGRLPLTFDNHQVGWLEVWGNGLPADAGARRGLSGVGRIIAVLLTGARHVEPPRDVSVTSPH